MDFTREEIEEADLVLVVNADGQYKWSSHRSNREVSNILIDIGKAVDMEKHTTGSRNVERLGSREI